MRRGGAANGVSGNIARPIGLPLKRFENWRFPKSQAEQQALAEQIGRDGYQLLEFLEEPTTEAWLRTVPTVEVLRQVWQQ